MKALLERLFQNDYRFIGIDAKVGWLRKGAPVGQGGGHKAVHVSPHLYWLCCSLLCTGAQKPSRPPGCPRPLLLPPCSPGGGMQRAAWPC